METIIKPLVEGGAVGVSIALVFLIYKISEQCSKNSAKTIEVIQKNTECLTHLRDSIDVNTEATKAIGNSLNNISMVAKDAMKIKTKIKL